ncbi:MAG TPA: M56 family metallopeptidase [Streptosporangiaceae bacterium]|nr:M56 family metallopeptidase [Streptosporangiaceae bacterium]
MAACPDAAACATVVGGSGVAVVVAVVVAAFLATWTARFMWVLELSRRATNALEVAAPPDELTRAVDRTLVRNVRCLAASEPTAFCIGGLRRRLYVSRGLIQTLRSDELDAVLLHEAYHRHRFDPIRRAMARSLADIFFFLPVVRWWSDWQIERSELAADRAVLKRLGPRPLAGALWVVGQSASPIPAVAFSGAAEVRAAQLLGATPIRRYPPIPVLTASAIGLMMSVALMSCVAHIAAALG